MDNNCCNRNNGRGCNCKRNRANDCMNNERRCREINEEKCPCSEMKMKKVDAISGMPVAMAYVPWQMWNDEQVFEADCGLANGTIFPELVKPFWVKCGLRG